MPDIQIEQKSHTFRNIILIIIIAVLIWQYILPVFVEVTTPSEYIQEYLFNEGLDSTWNIFYIDQTTAIKEELTGYLGYEKTMLQYHTYDIGITSNIPAYLTASYTLRLTINYWNVTISDWVSLEIINIKIPGYQPLFMDSWTISNDLLYIQYDITYSIHFQLLNIYGVSISAQDTNYNEQILRLNDYLNLAP